MIKTEKIDVLFRPLKGANNCRSRTFKKTAPLSTAAFTLIELIVVMAVIGVLVLLAAPKFIGYTREAKITQGTHDAKVIESSIDQHLFMHETIDEFLKNPSATDVLNTIAAQGALVSAKGIVDSVPDGDYYELSLSDIKNKLQVSMNSGNRVFVEKSGLVYVDIKSEGQVSNPGEPDVPDVPETDYYFEHTEEGVITNFYPSGKLSTLEKVTEVIIPDNINGTEIVAIGDNAFNNKGLRSVLLPNTVKEIGVGAFQNNTLDKIFLPSEVTVSDFAFNNNGINNKSGNIEDGNAVGTYIVVNEEWFKVTDPQWFIFNSAENDITGYHSSLVIDGITVQAPKNVVIPPSIDGVAVNKISNSAFVKKGLISVVIPDSVTTIVTGVFAENSLTRVVVGEGLNAVYQSKHSVFYRNPFAVNPDVKFEVSSRNQAFKASVSKNGFYSKDGKTLYAGNKVGEIEEGTETIEYMAFYRINLTDISLPNSLITIRNYAFSENKLTELNLPTKVKGIAEHAFSNNLIETVNLPNGLDSMGPSAFEKNKIKNLVVPGSLSVVSDSAFERNNIETLTLSEGIYHIGHRAFTHNSIKTLTLPSSMRNLGENAFSYNNMESLQLNDGLESILYKSFISNRLEIIEIPQSVTTIGGEAFSINPLTKITINSSDVLIGLNAFNYWLLPNLDFSQWDNIMGVYYIDGDKWSKL